VTPCRVTVCELHDAPDELARDWDLLADHVQAERSDLLLLPEMALAPWFAVTPSYDEETWRRAVDSHNRWVGRLRELGAPTVLGTRPIDRDGRRYNEAFVWESGAGYRPAHLKAFLPREVGFHECDWYDAGPPSFEPIDAGGVRIGFQICTEMWSMGHAQAYGKAGVQLLAVPRATSRNSGDKWLAGGRAAAVVAGAFSLSSSRTSTDHGVDLGGGGWIVSPEGVVLATTDGERRFATAEIDLAEADRAKDSYPRYALA
jgi:N-carbamoylputrescine amidase